MRFEQMGLKNNVVVQWIEEHSDKLIQLTQELVKIPSITGEEKRVQLFLHDKLKNLGMKSELVFPDINKDVYNRTAKLFQRFHKLLRVAVGAPQREFKCKFTVKSKSTPDMVFVFKFVSMKEEPPEFEFTSNGTEWRPWDKNYEDWEQERKTATDNP